MQVRRLTLAIMTAGACLPTSALAAGDYSPAWWLYSVGQACQIWADGIKRCLPAAAPGAFPAASAFPAPGAFPATAYLPGALPPGLDALMPAQARLQNQAQPQAQAAASPPWPVPALPLTTVRAPSTNPYLVHTPYAVKPAAQTAATQPAQPMNSAEAPLTPSRANLPALLPTLPRSAALAQVQPTAPTQKPASAPALTATPLTLLSPLSPGSPASTQLTASNAASRPPESPQAVSAGALSATVQSPNVQSPGAQSPKAPSPGAVATQSVKLEDALTHFEFDKAELTDAGRAALDAWVAGLTPGMRLSITGHADRLGPSRYNLALSRRRAESVLRHLGDKGMRANDISLHAKGESEPIVSCLGGPTPETKTCLAANRRVEIKPVM